MEISMATDPTKKKQADKVLEYIKKWGAISQLEALIDLGCMRLASRINDLKNAGHPISKDMVEVKTRSGTARIAVYKLQEQTVQS
jgi:hypothetical protein